MGKCLKESNKTDKVSLYFLRQIHCPSVIIKTGSKSTKSYVQSTATITNRVTVISQSSAQGTRTLNQK